MNIQSLILSKSSILSYQIISKNNSRSNCNNYKVEIKNMITTSIFNHLMNAFLKYNNIQSIITTSNIHTHCYERNNNSNNQQFNLIHTSSESSISNSIKFNTENKIEAQVRTTINYSQLLFGIAIYVVLIILIIVLVLLCSIYIMYKDYFVISSRNRMNKAMLTS